MVTLSLDCLSLTDTGPAEIIASASAAGFDLVSLWFQAPSAFPSALVTKANAADCASALADCGMAFQSVEVFDLVSEQAIDAYRPALELGARLGGRNALAIHYTNPDRSHAADLLALFAGVAGEYGLGVIVEPVAMGTTATLSQARDLIRVAGVDAGILFDTWHLVRSGCGVEELRKIEPGLIRYVQVNDGAIAVPREDWVAESLGERLYPGEGEFPLAELLSAAPKDVPWAFECPSVRRAAAGMTAREQAVEAMARMQELLRPFASQ